MLCSDLRIIFFATEGLAREWAGVASVSEGRIT